MTIILALSSILATAVPQVPAAQLAQEPPARPEVAFTPSSPVQGSVVLVTVRPARPHSAPQVGSEPGSADSVPAAQARPDSVQAARARPDSTARNDSTLSERARSDSNLVSSFSLDATGAPARARDQILGVRGTLMGEPLHFAPDTSGSWIAVGGLPIDATGSIRVPVIVERASGHADTLDAMLAVARGEYAMEKLTVAPRFGAPPDSALSARMARESARARGVSERSHATPRMWDSTWIRPRDTRITSGFGHGREFNGRVQSRHMGVDFAGAVGTPIRAANRGIVALVDEFYLGGNVIYIDHGAGVVTAYLHLSQHDVAEGDTVERGQVIGRVGATGRVTGPHLHWIARYGGITVNPLSLVELPPVPVGRGQ